MSIVIACLLALLPGDGVSFLTERQVLWLDRTQVVHFDVERAEESDRSFETVSSDPAVATVARAAEVLAGERRGTVRLAAHREGVATIDVSGAKLEVHVRPVARAADQNLQSVRLVSPVAGSFAWGSIAVGVEVTRGLESEPPAVILRSAGGREWAPARVVSESALHRYRFDLDTDDVPPGILKLTASAAGGEESREVALNIVKPAVGELVTGEFEAYSHVDRGENFGAQSPAVGSHPDASGEAFALCLHDNPSCVLPLTIETPGRYQMIARLRGDQGGGAFPTVGFGVDDPYNARTAVRVVDRSWHRLPVGLPVSLEAGERRLVVRFLNDLTIPNTTDRNLMLDRFELLRVGGGASADGNSMMSMSMSMSMGAGGGAPAHAGGLLRVAFEEPLDGELVNGRLQLRGYCTWTGDDTIPAPLVELWRNGEVLQTQQAAYPMFVLDRGSFTDGENVLQLRATTVDGRSAKSPEQTVRVPDASRAPNPRTTHRFSVLDDRWNEATRATLDDRGEEPGHRVARLQPDTVATLALPEDLEGEFDVLLESRALSAARRVVVTADLGGATRELANTEVVGWWFFRPSGRVTLPRGEKTISLRLDPSSLGGDSLDPELLVRAVLLREVRTTEDRRAPSVRIVYPPRGQELCDVDCVVVDAWDHEARLTRADVWIDGRPQHTFATVPDGVGRIVLPLVLRDVAPGPHTVSVVVTDDSENRGESREVEVNVLEEAPSSGTAFQRAVRLLDRFGFGPEPRELGELLALGPDAWLEHSLGEAGAGHDAAWESALAELSNAGSYGVRRACLTHALRTDNPVWLRFTLFCENHFSTWIEKARPVSKLREHQQFLGLGPAPFGELLLASATSPAMLRYLDQAQSYAARLNENYAREILELHTLGVRGGYTQADVMELAGLLSGLTLSEESFETGLGGALDEVFRYDPDLGDGRERRLLGSRFDACGPGERFDRLRHVLETLASHPSTAEFVCRKLCEHYVFHPAPKGMAEDLARVFLSTGGDLREVLTAMARDERFYEVGPRLTTPLDYALRLGRTSEISSVHWAIQGYLQRSGMALFDRATPDGWPEDDAAWADSNMTMQRWRLPEEIPWAVRTFVANDLRNRDAGDLSAWRQRTVDVCAATLLGRRLGEDSNRAALEFLASQSKENGWVAVDRLTVFFCSLPEASLE